MVITNGLIFKNYFYRKMSTVTSRPITFRKSMKFKSIYTVTTSVRLGVKLVNISVHSVTMSYILVKHF
jgi:hypothetical protein